MRALQSSEAGLHISLLRPRWLRPSCLLQLGSRGSTMRARLVVCAVPHPPITGKRRIIIGEDLQEEIGAHMTYQVT